VAVGSSQPGFVLSDFDAGAEDFWARGHSCQVVCVTNISDRLSLVHACTPPVTLLTASNLCGWRTISRYGPCRFTLHHICTVTGCSLFTLWIAKRCHDSRLHHLTSSLHRSQRRFAFRLDQLFRRALMWALVSLCVYRSSLRWRSRIEILVARA